MLVSFRLTLALSVRSLRYATSLTPLGSLVPTGWEGKRKSGDTKGQKESSYHIHLTRLSPFLSPLTHSASSVLYLHLFTSFATRLVRNGMSERRVATDGTWEA